MTVQALHIQEMVLRAGRLSEFKEIVLLRPPFFPHQVYRFSHIFNILHWRVI